MHSHGFGLWREMPMFGFFGATELLILMFAAAFAIFVFVKLVNGIGILKTLAWGLGLFFVGIVGLSLLIFMFRPHSVGTPVAVHQEMVRAHVRDSTDVRRWLEPVPNSEPVRVSSVQSAAIQAEESTTSAWDEEIVAAASVYPSISDCGRPLAAQLVKELQKENESKEELPKAEEEAKKKYRIALRNSKLNSNDFLNFVINFRKEFTTSFPGSFVDGMNAESLPAFKDKEKEKQYERLHVTVYQSGDEKSHFAKWDDRKSERTQLESGQMVCQLRRDGGMGQLDFVNDFVEKPWIVDPEKFMSQHDNRNFVIGFSERLATSAQEARSGALKDANIRLGKSTAKIFPRGYDMEKNVVDRFTQKLTMPYGSVWREAVLIDYKSPTAPYMKYSSPALAARAAAMVSNRVTVASNVNVGHADTSALSASRARRTGASVRSSSSRQVHPESAIAGLMLLTVVVGWISNWMTQGYYRKPVWTVTNTVFSIGLFILLFIVLLNFA